MNPAGVKRGAAGSIGERWIIHRVVARMRRYGDVSARRMSATMEHRRYREARDADSRSTTSVTPGKLRIADPTCNRESPARSTPTRHITGVPSGRVLAEQANRKRLKHHIDGNGMHLAVARNMGPVTTRMRSGTCAASAVVGIGLAACGVSMSDAPLRIEPATARLAIELGAPPPTASFRVFSGDVDVTSDVAWSLDGAPLGPAGAELHSDGLTGGAARLVASYRAQSAAAMLEARVRSRRSVAGARPDAPALFAAAQDVAVDAALEPGDDAVLPPSLGHLEVDFAADAADDLHEIALVGPYLDVRIYQPGQAGPRRAELTATEWKAVARTSRGTSAELIVRSLPGVAPATAHTASAHLAIADRDVTGALIFAAVPDQPNATASLWRYDLATANTAHWYQGANGGCVSCHVALSNDGRRLAAATIPAGSSDITGVIFDTTTRVKLSDDGVVPRWSSAAFEPSGRLVTTWLGAMTLRDGTTAAPIATLPIESNANQPAIARDGRSLAYSVPDDPTFPDAIGAEIRIRAFDAATATLGAARVLVPRGPLGVELPGFSPDGRWLVYSRRRGTAHAGAVAVTADGRDAFEISGDPRDEKARWASTTAPTRADGTVAEMAWIVLLSSRPVGARGQAKAPQLWLVAVDLDRHVATRPFHLPGQPADLGARHAPVLVPQGPQGPQGP
jgi:WD40 repeat protein